MAIFSCLATLLPGKKKKSKNGDGKHNVKSHVTISNSSPTKGKRSPLISEVEINDNSMVRVDFIGEKSYEGGDEHYDNRSMKRDCSDFNLQAKGELSSHESNLDLNNYDFENKVGTDEGISPEIMVASGHVSDPGFERKVFITSPVLKRSCSNIETKRATESINFEKRSNSYCNLQDLLGISKGGVNYDDYNSPLSVKTSCSADRVMLKKHSSCQVLPSRSKSIWWKLFLWSHRNLNTSNQKVGYSSDTHEPRQKTDMMKKKAIENQWMAFSLESSPRDRVDAWINSLGDCAIYDEEKGEEGTAGYRHLEIGESSSGKNHSHTSRHAIEEVTRANNIIQSLNSFSSVAHISNMGLKVIPAISAFGSLRSVNLSGNFIVHISPGSLPKGLHTLDLSRNKIPTIEGLRDLTKLRVLNLSYNRISRIGHGLSNCTIIKELYLFGNKISDVEGLHRLVKLAVLDLSFNKISTTKDLGQLVANYNSLLALNLLGNPIQSCIGDDHVRKTVLSLLPHIIYLNKQQIKHNRVREIPTSGDAGLNSRRRPTRRLGQVSSSSSSTKKKNRSKSKHQNSSSLRRQA